MAAPKPDPKRLALQAIAGATLSASAFLVPMLSFAHGLTEGLRLWPFLLAFFAPMAIGGTIWYRAHQRLSRGYRDDLWTEAELAAVRSLLAQGYWTWMSLGLLGIAVAMLSFTKHGGAFIYLATLPMNAVGSLRRLLIPPGKRTRGLGDWRNFKPLHSEHWDSAHDSHTNTPSS